jgi:hypothetical protein
VIRVAVPHRISAPKSTLREDATETFHLVLDALQHDLLAARKGSRRRVISSASSSSILEKPVKILPRTSGLPSFSALRSAGSRRRGKAPRDFACLVEGDELDVQIFGFFERELRVLAAGHDNRVKSVNVDVTYVTRFFNETCMFGCVNEAGREQIAGLPTAGIVWIARRIGLAGAAIGAEYFDLVVALFAGVKRMGKLTPSEIDKPTGRRRICRV